MPLISEASPSEKNSTYYLANESTCKEWEKFILSKDGKIHGVYNAWSLKIKAKILSKRTWNFYVEKSTFSSGNLLLSSKTQSLRESCKISTAIEEEINFSISKSFDHVYWPQQEIFQQLYSICLPAIKANQLQKVEVKNNLLTISFNLLTPSPQLLEAFLTL